VFGRPALDGVTDRIGNMYAKKELLRERIEERAAGTKIQNASNAAHDSVLHISNEKPTSLWFIRAVGRAELAGRPPHAARRTAIFL